VKKSGGGNRLVVHKVILYEGWVTRGGREDRDWGQPYGCLII